MKTLYLDIFSGISGDMFVGALLDLGADFESLKHELRKLPLRDYHLHAERKIKSNIEGTKFDVHLGRHHGAEGGPHAGEPARAPEPDHPHGHAHAHGHEHKREREHEPAREHEGHGHPHAHEHAPDHSHSHPESRGFADIRRMIESSALSEWVKEKSLGVFHRIARAEGKVHGISPDQVHFHEVGAVDSIIDIVSGCLGLETLGKPQVLSAPVVEGTGWVDCAHGRFPAPAPATLEILAERGVAITQSDEPHELVTPTGAAILAEFASSFGPMQDLVAQKIGYGLGTRDLSSRPNVLRAILAGATPDKRAYDWQTDTVAVLETNLDDATPEILGYFMEQALRSGALDAFYSPVLMKKNRPGTLLTVLCARADADRFAELILRETTAFGVRRTFFERRKLDRQMAEVMTPFGPIEVKLGRLNGRIVQVSPEFESCKKLAEEKNLPIKSIYDAARQAALSK